MPGSQADKRSLPAVPQQKDQPDAGAGDSAQRSRTRGCDVDGGAQMRQRKRCVKTGGSAAIAENQAKAVARKTIEAIKGDLISWLSPFLEPSESRSESPEALPAGCGHKRLKGKDACSGEKFGRKQGYGSALT